MKWLEAARLKTLVISIAPVAIGTAVTPKVDQTILWMTLLCAVLIQIGTNFANDYFDHKHGSDTKERKGPRRLIGAGLISQRQMGLAILTAFTLAAFPGAYLIYIGGWIIAALFALAVLCGIAYTAGRYSFKRTGLADLIVFIFFGPVATLSTYYLQTGIFDPLILFVSIAPGLIPVAVLCANNVRDRIEDKKCGKKTLAVRFGKRFGQLEYSCTLLIGILAIYPLGFYKTGFFLPLLSVIPAARLIHKMWTYKKSEELIDVLSGTAKVLALYTLLFCLGALL